MKLSACRMQQSRSRLVCPLAVNWTSRDGYAPGPLSSTDNVTHSSPQIQSPFDAATYQTRHGMRSCFASNLSATRRNSERASVFISMKIELLKFSSIVQSTMYVFG